MRLISLFLAWCIYFFASHALASRKEIREVESNDREMKTIGLTLGRSTILSFVDKPVKVVAGNSNYFNVEYIGNDLTLQPLANVETNLFVYTQSDKKYGFYLKVGSVMSYDDIVYVRWKDPTSLKPNKPSFQDGKPQKMINPVYFKMGTLEITLNKFLKLRGTKTYVIEFEMRNKGTTEIKLNQVDSFLSRNNERFPGQKLYFDRDDLKIHDKCRGRLFAFIEKNEDSSFYLSHQKKLKRIVISKAYL